MWVLSDEVRGCDAIIVIKRVPTAKCKRRALTIVHYESTSSQLTQGPVSGRGSTQILGGGNPKFHKRFRDFKISRLPS